MTPTLNLSSAVALATAPSASAGDGGAPPDRPTASIEDLSREHPWHAEFKAAWDAIELLYAGGSRMEKSAQQFLIKKAKEVTEVFVARCSRFAYQNVMGQGLDWYIASVFAQPPEIDCRAGLVDRATGNVIAAPNAETVDVGEREWYEQFRKNVDRKRSTDVAFFRDAFAVAMKYESAWILIDLPNIEAPLATLRDQQQAGLLDGMGRPAPYLVLYEPRQVVNWSEDEAGNLQWVCIHTSGKQQRWRQKPLTIDRWYYFDRQNYEVWERAADDASRQKFATQVGAGKHLMAAFGQVPVYRMRVPEGLWLADRTFTQAKDHLNTDNEYGYALKQANLSMPVIIGDMKEAPTLSEAGYLKLPANCSLEWTEPPGNSFARSEARIASLREEIMREMYIHYQSRTQDATPAAQSGYSKALDMTPAADIQTRYGQMVKDTWAWVLNSLARIRGENLVWELRGLHFADDPVASEIQNATQFKLLAVPSVTAEKENYKAAARVRFCEQPRTIIDKICEEIDAAPSDEEKQQQQALEQSAMQMDQAAHSAGLDVAKQQAAAPDDGDGGDTESEKEDNAEQSGGQD